MMFGVWAEECSPWRMVAGVVVELRAVYDVGVDIGERDDETSGNF